MVNRNFLAGHSGAGVELFYSRNVKSPLAAGLTGSSPRHAGTGFFLERLRPKTEQRVAAVGGPPGIRDCSHCEDDHVVHDVGDDRRD